MRHIVESGENLSGIAAFHGVSLAALLSCNPRYRTNPDRVLVGAEIELPVTSPVATTVAALAPAAVCEAALQLILASEVSGPAAYAHNLRQPTWPQGASGVTIGIGYDLGYVTAAEFRLDWQAELGRDTLERLAACCGVTGLPAREATRRLADVSVEWDMADRVFRGRTLPAYAARTRAALPNTARLPPESFGALVSLVYNRGASFAAAGDRFNEMRNIRSWMAAAAFDRIPAELRGMKRLWQGLAGLAGLVARREREALLFEAGLSKAEAVSPGVGQPEVTNPA